MDEDPFIDDSNIGHTVTSVNGTMLMDTKFGQGAIYLNGTSQYLTIPDSDSWDICASSSDDWTIDFWIKLDATASRTDYVLGQFEDTTNLWSLYHFMNGHSGGDGFRFYLRSGGSYIIDTGATSNDYISDNDWHHVALVKVADEYAIYLDGVQTNYTQDSSTDTLSGSLSIGWYGFGSNYTAGYMDEIRIQKSNAFSASPNSGKTDTITVPTSAHTPDANTQLLLHIDADPIVDSSGKDHTVTEVSNPIVDYYKFQLGSGYFDGTNDYLLIPDSNDWDIFGSNSDDWTIDFWIKHKVQGGASEVYMAQYESGNNHWRIGHLNGLQLKYRYGGTNYILFTGTQITDNAWHHIAVVKKGSTYGLYLDGTRDNYVTGITTTNTYSANLHIMQNDADSYVNGWIDEVRIQHSNYFDVDPATDTTLTVPTEQYSQEILPSRNQIIIIT
jgi:hypothetical protein